MQHPVLDLKLLVLIKKKRVIRQQYVYQGAQHFENFLRGFQECSGRIPKDSQDSKGCSKVFWGFLGIPENS